MFLWLPAVPNELGKLKLMYEVCEHLSTCYLKARCQGTHGKRRTYMTSS